MMQKTFAGKTAKQIIAAATTDATGRKFATINGTDYTVVEHECVELVNGNWTSTIVLENAERRIVLETNDKKRKGYSAVGKRAR